MELDRYQLNETGERPYRIYREYNPKCKIFIQKEGEAWKAIMQK